MKVRWTRESIRLRVTPTELARLQAGEPVSEQLPIGSLDWTVRLSPGQAGLALAADDGVAVITLSRDDVAILASPDAEGVYATQDGTRLLVEKDFPCAHPHAHDAGEPETERFAPTASFTSRRTARA